MCVSPMRRTSMPGRSLLPATLLFFLLATHAAAESPVASFTEQYCLDCHSDVAPEADLDLSAFPPPAAAKNADTLQRVFDALTLGEMPPDDATQPTPAERQAMIDHLTELLASSGTAVVDKSTLPGMGNYVDHQALFTEPAGRKAATPARLWRLSPHVFMQRANGISRTPLLRAQRNQGGDGLHPAFAYMTPPHTFRDSAGAHVFEEATTELLFDICWQIAELQVSNERQPSLLREVQEQPELDDASWMQVIRYQFSAALRREPTAEEIADLLTLARATWADTTSREALQTVLAAVLLKPEAVYRFEVGQGEPDEFNRVWLAPYELMHAISYALTDVPPDEQLRRDAEAGRLANRKTVKKHVTRLLADAELSTPRLLRFFQEYFEYPRAAEVFKDARRANAVFANERIDDADRFVTYVLEHDQDVLRRLLTDDHIFVLAAGLPGREPPEKRAREFLLPDYGFPSKWQWEKEQPLLPLAGHRSGMLTYPAWLLAFSDNEKNQAIQRGRWIWTKLLGGTVPDTPIGVDAKLPDDPHLTLREKMQVTRDQYCWRCHQRMDPLGLPLEQFDDFGRYRDRELDRPVETSGTIAIGDPAIDGPVDDPFEMLDRLAHSERVEQVFVRHVFRYFLGRNETLDDAPTLIDAHRAYRESGGSMRALVTSLLTSDSFLYRQLPAPSLAARTTKNQ